MSELKDNLSTDEHREKRIFRRRLTQIIFAAADSPPKADLPFWGIFEEFNINSTPEVGFFG